MTTRKPESGGPREPHNIPIRVHGAGSSIAEDPEYRALLRDIRALISDGIRSGVIRLSSRKKSKKVRRKAKTAKPSI